MKPFIEALLVEKRKAGLKGGGFKVAIWSTGAK